MVKFSQTETNKMPPFFDIPTSWPQAGPPKQPSSELRRPPEPPRPTPHGSGWRLEGWHPTTAVLQLQVSPALDLHLPGLKQRPNPPPRGAEVRGSLPRGIVFHGTVGDDRMGSSGRKWKEVEFTPWAYKNGLPTKRRPSTSMSSWHFVARNQFRQLSRAPGHRAAVQKVLRRTMKETGQSPSKERKDIRGVRGPWGAKEGDKGDPDRKH